MAARVHRRLHLLAYLGLLAAGSSCTLRYPREACTRDGECPPEQVCYPDDQCAPIGVAIRQGGEVGDACTVQDGTEVGCELPDQVCRMGKCVGPDGRVACEDAPDNALPLFGGATAAISDGPDAVVINWAPAADETVQGELTYRIYQGTVEGVFDFTAPVATLVGQVQHRQTGLTEGQTYFFLVRATDSGGLSDCNRKAVSATPRGLGECVDYQQGVRPILEANCTRCHVGDAPPQGLRLDSYAGVHAGGRTGNEVIRCQPDSSLIYLKVSLETPPVGARMPLDGPPFLTAFQQETLRRWIEVGAPDSCAEPGSICDDQTPPGFGGITSATVTANGAGATLCWTPGSDDTASPPQLVYDAYQSLTPGGQDFSGLPTATSSAGANCLEVGGLLPSQEHCWTVRARDLAGNRDANTVEQCLTTPEAACIDYASLVQPIFNAECVHCHSGATAPRELRLDSYQGVIAGGLSGNEVVACRPEDSLLHQKLGASPPFGARMPADGPPFLGEGQIELIRRWIDEGARSACDQPEVCSDPTPPQFGGLTAATAPSATSAQLCWTAATDNLTAQAELLYDVFASPGSGGQSFTTPVATSGAGETCLTLQAVSPSTGACYVVRARDGAGNRDGNTVERCLTQPALAPGCVDYAQHVQPLFDRHCVRCHSGPTAPQSLRLTSYAEALAGSVRRNEIDACNAAGSLLAQKLGPNPPLGKRMPLDGPPYLSAQQLALVNQWIDNGATPSCGGPTACADVTSPSFGGVTSATAVNATTVQVCWSPATDQGTPPESLRYEVYESTTPGAQSLGDPAPHSVVNASCLDVPAGPGTQLCFVARARDLVGNLSANTEERCVTTPAADCAVEFEPHIRPIFAARCNHCHNAGEGRRYLDLSSYGGLLAAGALRNEVRACDPGASFLLQKLGGNVCGRRMPFDGPPWVSPSQLSLLTTWIVSGARETCAQPSPCVDAQAPSFFGATSVSALDPATARLCWNAATDNSSGASQITYDIWEASAPGGQSFSVPAHYAAKAGSTCQDIPVAPGQRSCFVVRARDLKGNRDLNTTERCLTAPAGCVEYGSRVQTIFNARCIQCHSGSGAPDGIQWDSYEHALASGELEACDPSGGKLVEVVDGCEMPLDTSAEACSTRACLTPSQRALIRAWINQGASPGCPPEGC